MTHVTARGWGGFSPYYLWAAKRVCWMLPPRAVNQMLISMKEGLYGTSAIHLKKTAVCFFGELLV